MKIISYIVKLALPFIAAYFANIIVAEHELELLARRITVFFIFMLIVSCVVIVEFIKGDR